MALRLLAIDPNTQGGNCLAVIMDEQTGDVLFQGWTETDPATLEEAAQHSPLAPHETLVRFPARMRKLILEALSDRDTGT
ncbi:hypothetical protein SMC26_28950 [Actinomadura fulvescens]|uniref:tRNA (Adenosine(37)-N6)-threonylcarbamoyltransferase complex dimerization subunit type 1 TsaB n=1 Tax=Actinomadura fulvescens TaxID=46160 RepID=A0ABN3PYT1_9ACTN